MNKTNQLADTSRRGDFVFLRADTLHLLLLREEIALMEHIQVRPQPTETPGILQLPGDTDGFRFLVLSEKMALLNQCPPERFVSTVFNDCEDICWCWNEVQILIDKAIDIWPVPDVILKPAATLRQFTVMDEKLVFICNTEQLKALA